MKLTREEAIRQHRKMWRWIADKLKSEEVMSHFSIASYKREYIETYFPGSEIYTRCFLCEYADSVMKSDGVIRCKYCPLKWGGSPDDSCMYLHKHNRIIQGLSLIHISEPTRP